MYLQLYNTLVNTFMSYHIMCIFLSSGIDNKPLSKMELVTILICVFQLPAAAL